MKWRSKVEGKEVDVDVAGGVEVIGSSLCLLVGDLPRHVLLCLILPGSCWSGLILVPRMILEAEASMTSSIGSDKIERGRGRVKIVMAWMKEKLGKAWVKARWVVVQR